MKKGSVNGRIGIDLLIIAASIAFAVWLAREGVFEQLLVSVQKFRFIGSFIAGMFFTSLFTAAPATVALGAIARVVSPWEVGLLGGLGAMIGDSVIFWFVRDRLAQDIRSVLQQSGTQRLTLIFRKKLFRRLTVFLGALIVASPLPDELGLTLMGLSKMGTQAFLLVSFLLNSAGILVIGLIARTIF